MTHTDYTKDILNIKDENVYFYDTNVRKKGKHEIDWYCKKN